MKPDFHFCVRDKNGIWTSKTVMSPAQFLPPKFFENHGYSVIGNYVETENKKSLFLESYKSKNTYFKDGKNYFLVDMPDGPFRGQSLIMIPSELSHDAQLMDSKIRVPAPKLDLFPPIDLGLNPLKKAVPTSQNSPH